MMDHAKKMAGLHGPVFSTADPKASYLAHAEEIHEAIERVLAGGQYILGPEVRAFEDEFSSFLGGGFTVGVANGTDALELALRAGAVVAGDGVATVAHTASATAAAIVQIGARPIFVEIEPATQVMSPEALAAEFERRPGEIKAVVPVHLYGYPARMESIVEIAGRNGAIVVEDCAQAHGARWKGRRVGAWGTLAAFSFYPTKNLGALGDGGAVFTRDPALAKRVRLLREYGWRERYVAELPARNSRLDEIQAAILRVKLRYLDQENALRRTIAETYHHHLADTPLRLPATSPLAEQVYHQFAIRLPEREALRTHLESLGIMAAALYPVPVHRQPAYTDRATHLPETEKACAEVLCLPCHPSLGDADVARVSDAIVAWYSRVP
jgi:dTDP-4-amino-4,6-dideoxygalactose transaminase